MPDPDALRAKRYRLHHQNDHSLCKPGCGRARLAVVADGAAVPMPAEVEELERAVRDEFPANDPLSRALALRLVRLAGGSGPAAVAALKSLGELVAAQRDPVARR
jgi:hypothetical protein